MTQQHEVPSGVRKALEQFLSEHGGSADAVLQPIGRAGVRITLVGTDGVLGDQVVADVDTAQAAVAAVEGITVSAWERELVSKVTPREGHYAKMAGWVART